MAINPHMNGNGKQKEPVLVVVQLSGGNDFMNTVIPFTEGAYYDARPLVQVAAKDPLLRKVLQMSNEDVVRFWLEKQYVSAEAPPSQVSGDEAAIKFVSSFKGGIGFISRASLETSKNIKSILEVNY